MLSKGDCAVARSVGIVALGMELFSLVTVIGFVIG